MIFIAEKKISNFGIYPYGQLNPCHIGRVSEYLPVNIITNCLSGYKGTLSIAIKTRLAKHPCQRLFSPFAGHLY